MSDQIKAVLFDFGGVFTDSPFGAVEEHGLSLGAAPGQISDIVFGGYHEDGDHPWHRLERGELSREGMQVLEKMSKDEQATFLEFQRRLHESNRVSTASSFILAHDLSDAGSLYQLNAGESAAQLYV